MGGNWNNGANAGLWYVSCNYAASYSGTNIGARLANGNGQKPVAYGRRDSACPSGRPS